MKRLSKQQIEQLFAFTKKHYVEFYDVQVELVDHLANAIEEQWKENPTISFEDALQTEFKKFGIFGFTGLVEQKQTELHKHYNKMLVNEALKFLSIPKAIVTVILYLTLFFLLKNTGKLGETISLTILSLSFIYFMIDGFRFMLKIKKQQKIQGRNWLIQSVAQSVFSLPVIYLTGFGFSIISNFFREDRNSELSVLGLNVFTVFILIHVLTFYVFSAVIKPRFLQSIKETSDRFQFA